MWLFDKFPKMFCSSCGMECHSTANFCHQSGQQPNLSQVSNKAASSVDNEKLLKKYFHGGYPYAAFIMWTSDCSSGCFKVLWCISSLIWGASDYNPGQKCWEGSIALEITPSPLSMLDFLGRLWWLIFHEEPHEQSQHWKGGGHKSMSFPK